MCEYYTSRTENVRNRIRYLLEHGELPVQYDKGPDLTTREYYIVRALCEEIGDALEERDASR